jgi:hypothetical protein
MPLWSDAPLHLTFEELERDELRRAEAVAPRHEDTVDGTFPRDITHGSNVFQDDDADDEE